MMRGLDLKALASACAALACMLTALAMGCSARERFVPDAEEDGGEVFGLGASSGHVAVFDLSRGAPEQTAGGLFQLPASHSFAGLVRELERVTADAQAKSVFVRLSQQPYDWAQSEELGRLLNQVKGAGKQVICHAHTLTNATIWLVARGCTRIWLSPAGEVINVGIAAQMTYLKGALDKLKIEADFLSMGRFKSGGEPITREGPSDASRENLTETLQSIRQTWLDGVISARSMPGLREALENGPFIPAVARTKGLIDAVGFESEALAEAKQKGNVERTRTVFGPGRKEDGGGLAELIRILAGTGDQGTERDHVAVVTAVGGITMTSSEGFGSDGITAGAMLKTLRRLKKDKSVKAVVLRLDSPGGSPLASDLIWHELMALRKEKPVVASIGTMAASGGYYLACAAHSILAERTSIVGSIGVFGGKFVIGPALEEVGITSFTFPASNEPGAAARAAYMSPLTAWDQATRERVEAHMRHIYELFLERVAKGRGISVDQVRKSAEGAIFSGRQGKQRRLVDEFGGLQQAISLARRRAGLPTDAPVVVEGLQETLIESLFSGDDPRAGDVQAALEKWQARQRHWRGLVPENLRTFVTSLLPLTQGEHSLVALPFVFSVR